MRDPVSTLRQHFGKLRSTEAPGPTVGKRFQKLLAQVGIPLMRYRRLRHGAASLTATQSDLPYIAMDVLGQA